MVSIQINASDESGISKVRVYAREKGSSQKGVLLGSASSSPYVISWPTYNIPNQVSAELYAEAIDESGMTGTSDAVYVKPVNPGLPQLSYFVAYTYPAATPAAATQKLQDSDAQLPHAPTVGAVASGGKASSHKIQKQQVAAQATPINVKYALRWGLLPVNTANEYYLYASTEDAVGTYKYVKKITATSTSSEQSGSAFVDKIITEAVTKDQNFHGMVTAKNASGESGLSNSMSTNFLVNQPLNLSPADGAQVASPQVTISWDELPEADEYLYYLYASDPTVGNPSALWTNYPKTTPNTNATYPAEKPALTKGTYYWWVAGVRFNADGRPTAFSFSKPTTFIVP
ncbi:hypothetical protein GCM10008938_19230 [Deinococcus roseus]|uniref:Fibronectin type-III domain-containing protein n=1 Tax=Deinococcus roseus TaxID=392414 RepID=A0ABQ2CYK0_9DEIO|nr:hypothetical protein GCM10008938_19230 [Deinococcus roseus]